jgi:hypothetical protein
METPLTMHVCDEKHSDDNIPVVVIRLPFLSTKMKKKCEKFAEEYCPA